MCKALPLLLLLSLPAYAQDPATPQLQGYVTRVESRSDFDVNGVRILCGDQIKKKSNFYSQACPQERPFIGQPMAVYGSFDRKRHSIEIDWIDDSVPPPSLTASYGIIQSVEMNPRPQIEADGYRIVIDAKTELKFAGTLRSLADVAPNMWIDYKGKQQPDGSMLAESASFMPHFVNRPADAVRARTDYDPSKVKQPGNVVIDAFIGTDAKKIPAWPDAAMQARVAKVAARLIPPYQKRLADSDPTKIRFRFQVTAGDQLLRSVVTLPSGIILVPHQMVERMQNDSQLAAILADSIAVEMEAQNLRMRIGVRPSRRKTAEAVGLISPGLGVTVLVAASVILRREEEQSARVSLDLMHEAGYDIDQAPLAWWILASKPGKPLSETLMPNQTINLYRQLGTTWCRQTEAPAPATAK